jgi:hypothetical protein
MQIINWDLIGTTTSTFPKPIQRFINKWTHQWLPTLDHPSMRQTHLRNECPCCKREPETNLHFHECTETIKTITEKLIPAIQQYNTKNNTPEILTNLLLKGLTPNTQPHQLHNEHNQLIDIIVQQSNIGWQQLYYGRWAIEWQFTYNQLTNSHNGQNWCKQQLKIIWYHQYSRWTYRNDILHDKTNNFEKQRINDYLKNTITDLYTIGPKLTSIDRQRLEKPLDKLLKCTEKQKYQWITTNKRTLEKRAKETTNENTQLYIDQLFNSADKRPIPRNTTIASNFQPP